MNDDGTLHDGTLHDAELEELARRLGANAAERLDVEHTAQAVLTRLRDERQAPRRVWAGVPAGWLRIAAAIVVLAGAGLVARALRAPPPPAGAVPQAEAVDLGDLSSDQLRELLNTIDQPGVPEPVAAQDLGLEDLTPQQLRTLLASLEA